MKKKNIVLYAATSILSLFALNSAQAQVKIGDNPNTIQPSSLLELESTDKGVLIPRMTTAQRDAISSAGSFNSNASHGLIVFNSDDNKFYFWNSATPAWELIGGANQNLSIAGQNLSISGGNTVVLPDNDAQNLNLSGNTLSISNGNNVDLSGYMDNTDAQTLSITGADLSISGGNTVTLPTFTDTDDQDLALAGNSLSLTNDATPVDLTPYLDNTDAQTLNLATNTLSISNGNSVDLSGYLDNTDAQDMSLAGNTLSLTNDATTVDLSGYLDNTDAQTLSVAGDNLTISGGNTVTILDDQDMSLSGNTLSLTNDATPVDLTPYLDNTDAQTLNLATNTLSISGGNNVDLSGYLDNTDAQTLSVAGDNLTISGGNTVTILDDQTLTLAADNLSITNGNTVSLAPYLDNTDAQTLSLVAGNLTISGGNTVSLAAFTNTDDQDLSLAGNTLSLTNDATPVDLSGYLDNTDAQTLALAANTLSISGGNNVSLAGYLDNTDNQDLSLAGNTLSLTNDATTVDLAPYLDNTDAQTLSVAGDNLTISGGNTVTILDDQTLTLAANNLSITNGNTVSLAGYLDNTDNQDLTLVGNTLSLTNDATTVNLTPYLDNTDAQTLALAANTLSISGGNNVSLAGYLDNTDAQTLSYAAGTLTISGGNSVALTGLGDNLGNHISTMPITTTLTSGNIIQIGDDAHLHDVNDANYIGIHGIQSGGNIAGIRFGSTAFPNNPRIYGTATTLDFITNATTRMSILSGGNVGVGVTNPNSPFAVRTSNGAANARVTSLANAIGDVNFELTTSRGVTTNNPDDVMTQFGQAYNGGNITDGFRFHRGSSANDGAISVLTNTAERMRITSAGSVGIGTTTPTAMLHVNGAVRVGAYTLPATDGTASQVLTTNGAGAVTWTTPAAGGVTTASNGLTLVGSDVRFGGTLTAATTVNQGANSLTFSTATGNTIFNTTDAAQFIIQDNGTPMFGFDGNTNRFGFGMNNAAFVSALYGLYGYGYQFTATGDGQATLYAERNRDSQNNGTSYSETGTNSGLHGHNFWGDLYTFGVVGSSWNDYTRTGGILGAEVFGAYWGSLGYRSSGALNYGVYGSAAYASGGGFMGANGNVQTGIGGGFYGGVMGGWTRGEVLGHTASGELYASYNVGNEYTSGYQADVVTTNNQRVAAYANTSTQLKVYDDGFGQLNNGSATITLSPEFTALMAQGRPVVTVTAIGAPVALYVKNIEGNRFTVATADGSAATVEFSWTAVAKRVDHQSAILPEALRSTEFDANMKEVMFNENNLEQNGKPIWWDGSNIRFDQAPEKPKGEKIEKPEGTPVQVNR